jgi:hypothetical protein
MLYTSQEIDASQFLSDLYPTCQTEIAKTVKNLNSNRNFQVA